MILAVAASQMEMDPLLDIYGGSDERLQTLVCGVGPIETAARLGYHLATTTRTYRGILHFGVGGAYISSGSENQPGLLSLCLAEREVFGDFGVCLPDNMAYFDEELGGEETIEFTSALYLQCTNILNAKQLPYFTGNFVTVSGASGTAKRGEMLRSHWRGICENMEGFAVARVAADYNLPVVELRVISNFVEDRNLANWELENACLRAAEVAWVLAKEIK